ncbi:MAG TPA: HD domain-containing protein [Thermoguttaceae bacterium]|nr:HD domain-containing protein [Thermoguttaceae bacterium]
MHGFIRFSPNERRIIDHSLFRRLRFIKQLALTEFLYPGATHSRFEHSLGTMHVATLAFDRLAQVKGDVMERTFGKVPELEDRPLAKARQILRLAALLHDVGHGPFSHAAESVVHEGAGHEELSIQVVEQDDLLGGELDEAFFSGCRQLVAKILRGGDPLPRQIRVLSEIVSGEMDADRTDYLIRDSLHCGVEYGRFDYQRMIECLELLEGPGDSLEIGLNRGGIHTFEALILARYQMNSQVLYHPVRRIYDFYLKKYLSEKADTWFRTPTAVLGQNDITVIATMFEDAARPASRASEWAKRITERRHHRKVHETGETTSAIDLRCSRTLAEQIGEEFPDCDFVWDHAQAKIHSLLLPDDMQDAGLVQLHVIDKSGFRRLMGEQSHILRRVPRRFQIARLFVDRDPPLTLNERRKIEEYASVTYGKLGGR